MKFLQLFSSVIVAASAQKDIDVWSQINVEDWVKGIRNGTHSVDDIKEALGEWKEMAAHAMKERFTGHETDTCLTNDECESDCCARAKKGSKGSFMKKGKNDEDDSDDDDGDDDRRLLQEQSTAPAKPTLLKKLMKKKVCKPAVYCRNSKSSQMYAAGMLGFCCILCLCCALGGQYMYFKRRLRWASRTQNNTNEQQGVQLGTAVPPTADHFPVARESNAMDIMAPGEKQNQDPVVQM